MTQKQQADPLQSRAAVEFLVAQNMHSAALLQAARITRLNSGRLMATINPTIAGRYVIRAAFLSVAGEAVTFARIPLQVAAAGTCPGYLAVGY